MHLLYFAWVRDRIGRASETVALPPGIATVGALLDHLAAKGGGYAAALVDRSVVRVAVNQAYVNLDHPIGPDDEVALFPPVTGG